MGEGSLNPEEGSASAKVRTASVLRQRFVRGFIAFVAGILLRIRFEGVENIPAQGGLIITTNHMSRIDTPILLLNPVRTDLAALVTDKYKKYPFFSFLITSNPHIWIDRTRADFSALKTAIRYLQEGGSVGVAPEGTRSTEGGLMEGKQGAVLLAVRAGVPIVAVGVSGTDKFHQNLKKLRRIPVTVRFGEPYSLPPFEQENRNEYMQRTTDEVMCRIAAVLPEEYRGFYKNHPRLLELLDQD